MKRVCLCFFSLEHERFFLNTHMNENERDYMMIYGVCGKRNVHIMRTRNILWKQVLYVYVALYIKTVKQIHPILKNIKNKLFLSNVRMKPYNYKIKNNSIFPNTKFSSNLKYFKTQMCILLQNQRWHWPIDIFYKY